MEIRCAILLGGQHIPQVFRCTILLARYQLVHGPRAPQQGFEITIRALLESITEVMHRTLLVGHHYVHLMFFNGACGTRWYCASIVDSLLEMRVGVTAAPKISQRKSTMQDGLGVLVPHVYPQGDD